LTKNFVVIPAVLMGIAAVASAQAAAPSKVATIVLQEAILRTKDGQKAASDLQSTFTPKRQAIEKKQGDLQGLQEQLKKGSATMSDEAKSKIMRDIDSLQKSLQRDGQDFDSDVQEAEGKIMNELGPKMMDVVIKYATQNSFAMVVDVSQPYPQGQVLWADPSVDITAEAIKLYDQAHPNAGAPTAKPTAPLGNPPAGVKPPSAPPANPPAATKPPAVPAGKKQ
jgi:outer membrane protein